MAVATDSMTLKRFLEIQARPHLSHPHHTPRCHTQLQVYVHVSPHEADPQLAAQISSERKIEGTGSSADEGTPSSFRVKRAREEEPEAIAWTEQEKEILHTVRCSITSPL